MEKAVGNVNDTGFFKKQKITGLVPAMPCNGPHFQVVEMKWEKNGVKVAEDFLDKILQPDCFFGCVGDSNIFGFSSGESDKFLTLGRPRYSSSIDNKDIARYSMLIGRRHSISVRESKYSGRIGAKGKTKVLGLIEVSVDLAKSCPMFVSWVRRELR